MWTLLNSFQNAGQNQARLGKSGHNQLDIISWTRTGWTGGSLDISRLNWDKLNISRLDSGRLDGIRLIVLRLDWVRQDVIRLDIIGQSVRHCQP